MEKKSRKPKPFFYFYYWKYGLDDLDKYYFHGSLSPLVIKFRNMKPYDNLPGA